MLTKPQRTLLRKFADLSDRLLELEIISTDSFTGEIGEYVVCNYFKLKKAPRITKGFDGVCALGDKYQVKAKIVSDNSFRCKITNLDTSSFKFLTVVYFDRQYNPIKILKIPASTIVGSTVSIDYDFLKSGVEIIDGSQIKLPVKCRQAINNFAEVYNELQSTGIIRSRRVVGDLGEFYACKRLDLTICENQVEKGIDARSDDGLTFEVKTRRVYESDRRLSKVRRLNKLSGKSADYLIVVALDRSFDCAGMWLMPMKNIKDAAGAKMQIVNTTARTMNLVPSKIGWLTSGEEFISFNLNRQPIKKQEPVKRKTINAELRNVFKDLAKPLKESVINHEQKSLRISWLAWVIMFIISVYLLVSYFKKG